MFLTLDIIGENNLLLYAPIKIFKRDRHVIAFPLTYSHTILELWHSY